MCYIWRDQYDKDNFHVGTKSSYGRFNCWFTIFCDAISDCFGQEAYEFIKNNVTEVPMEVEFRNVKLSSKD